MRIKPAQISDSKVIHEIHTRAVKKTCSNFYTKEQIKAWLKTRSPEGYHEGIEKGEMYIAELNDKIVGFGHAVPGEVLAIFVDPVCHKKGIGKTLLDYGMRIALKNHKKIKVESTINAENFYKKHGFIKTGDGTVRKNNINIPIVIMEFSPRL